jgi:hypothetical protein
MFVSRHRRRKALPIPIANRGCSTSGWRGGRTRAAQRVGRTRLHPAGDRRRESFGGLTWESFASLIEQIARSAPHSVSLALSTRLGESGRLDAGGGLRCCSDRWLAGGRWAVGDPQGKEAANGWLSERLHPKRRVRSWASRIIGGFVKQDTVAIIAPGIRGLRL